MDSSQPLSRLTSNWSLNEDQVQVLRMLTPTELEEAAALDMFAFIAERDFFLACIYLPAAIVTSVVLIHAWAIMYGLAGTLFRVQSADTNDNIHN